MILTTTKLQYQENGAWVTLVEPDLISCDVTYINTQSRNQFKRVGNFTNEAIDTIQINIVKGSHALLDNMKEDMAIPLKFSNGAVSIQGNFILGNKKNHLHNTRIFMSFYPDPDGEFIIASRAAEAGTIIDVEVDGVSVVQSGVAEINLTNKVNKIYGTSTSGKAYIVDSAGNQGSLAITEAGAANSLVKTTNSGKIKLNSNPVNDEDAARKLYVDSQVATVYTEIDKKVTKATDSTDFSIGYDAGGLYIIK